MTVGHQMVISETITTGIFNTLEEADAFSDKFLNNLPANEKRQYHANYSIKHQQFIVKIKRSDFRLGISLIERTCPRCSGRVQYWSFTERSMNLAREQREKIWLNPQEMILCYGCYYSEVKDRRKHDRTHFSDKNRRITH